MERELHQAGDDRAGRVGLKRAVKHPFQKRNACGSCGRGEFLSQVLDRAL